MKKQKQQIGPTSPNSPLTHTQQREICTICLATQMIVELEEYTPRVQQLTLNHFNEAFERFWLYIMYSY